MGLCPDNRITGGRTHAAHTRKVQNRLANALRMAAPRSVSRTNSKFPCNGIEFPFSSCLVVQSVSVNNPA
jgi:hypothetical protein